VDHRVRNIVILGGGTAGWMAASYLGKALQGSARITVLEAPSIPRIGVGEATVPNLQSAFFDYLGIPEDEWMRECNASFKIAVKFINWRTPGEGISYARTWHGRPDHFHHPFGLLAEHEQVPISHYWAYQRAHGCTDEPFDYACFAEPAMMDSKLAPRWLDGRRASRYAWHFDAQQVAEYLRRFATRKQGVVHIEDEMTEAALDERGFITALHTKGGRMITGDLFIDCSGFRGLLINKVLGEPFIDMSNHLLNDSAVAASVPSDDAADGIEPYTSAIAMKSGWAWKIPLLGRFGSGYVYSSAFCDQDTAAMEFRALWDLPMDTPLNNIRFRVGRNRRAWVNNCVSIGLSSCFVEPLESTGIYFIYSAIYNLVRYFPDRTFNSVLISRFNDAIESMFDDTRDFLQAHFYFSPRTDTPFWQANKELTLGDGMREKYEMFASGLAINQPVSDESNYYGNFETEFRNFWTNGSYYCIFTGMGVEPVQPLPLLEHRPDSVRAAMDMFTAVKTRQRTLAQTLPSHVEYLRMLHKKTATAAG
jgi:tryptophan 6-halogenase